jgi:hypothetical protein
MKLHALIPFLLAPLAASVPLAGVNNGVVDAYSELSIQIQEFKHLTKLDDITPANGAIEDFATHADGESLSALTFPVACP